MYPKNGILRLYNQFPRCYNNIQQMTEQLSVIAAMGFNAVWINPIQMVGQIIFGKYFGNKRKLVKGSLYAMSDSTKIDKVFSDTENDYETLREYAQTAIQLGLTPIFDLVLNHVATDSFLIQEHQTWFKNKTSFGSDVRNFDYEQKIDGLTEILNFWKEYITKYFELGFQGVRVDAVKHIPIKIQRELYNHIYETCQRLHNVQPIIFAEVFLHEEDNLAQISNSLLDLGITHATNCLHWTRFTQSYRENRGWEKQHENPNVLHQIFLLRQFIVKHDGQNISGGTIGFTGCHDTKPLYEKALTDIACYHVEKRGINVSDTKYYWKEVNAEKENLKNDDTIITFHLREIIASMAFTSDAGWYLLSGDEFGHSEKKSVFDFYKPCENGNSFYNQWQAKFDLRSFIANVNETLSKLAPPSSEIFWSQHVVLEKKPGLMIIIRHHKAGYSGPTELVVINLTENPIALSYTDINTIAEIASEREKDNPEQKRLAKQCVIAAKIYCVGPITLDQSLAPVNIQVFNSSWDEHLQRSLPSDTSATSSSSPDSIVPPSSPLPASTEETEEPKKTKESSSSHRPNSYSHWSQTNTATSSSSHETSSSAPSYQNPHISGQ